ncbi:MAG: hypothetical protein K0R92_3483 [Lachnospiraceae bacterium]|nr:hypothetical protein [Lachnospiraceae bacterium]
MEISRTRINKSNYSAAPRYVTVGTKVEEEKKEDTEKDPSKIKDTDDKKQDQNQNQNQDQDNEQSNTETQSQSTETNNLANPDNQLQADTWDPSWDDEGLEDE